MKLGDRVNWRIKCLNEDHFGTIIAKSTITPNLFLIHFDKPVIGSYQKPVMAREVLEKDLELI